MDLRSEEKVKTKYDSYQDMRELFLAVSKEELDNETIQSIRYHFVYHKINEWVYIEYRVVVTKRQISPSIARFKLKWTPARVLTPLHSSSP